ncbi:MAG: hypothetical protein AABZ60_03225 [Planctomycetota bacterium]
MIRNPLFLARHYLKFHPRKFWVLTICGTLTILLPLITFFVFQEVNTILTERSERYPMIVGGKGSALGLVFHVLFYATEISERTTYGALTRIQKMINDNQLEGYAIPILTGYKAMQTPIVGVSADFYDFAKLSFRQGRAPGILGEVVVGAQIAQKLGVAPGKKIHSDIENLFNLASSFRSLLHVVGVLAPTGGPEDHVIFCDIKTTWLLSGIYHGHQKNDKLDPATSGSNIQQIGIPEYVEVTPENMDTFHPHGDPDTFPITALIFVPGSEKARVVIQGLLNLEKDLQAVSPAHVISEFLEIIFQIKKLLHLYFVLVIISTILLFTLVLFLSLRLREREFQTIQRMGGSRGTIVLMVTAEYGFIFLSSLCFAVILSWVAFLILPSLGYATLF